MTPVGYRFQVFVTPKSQWKEFRARLRDRLALVGRDPELAAKYAPSCWRAVFGGTVDRRLTHGSLTYGSAGLQRNGASSNVEPGRFDRALEFEFGQAWEQPEDDFGEAFGLFVNAWHFGFRHCEVFESDTIPEERLANVDVWAALKYLANVEATGTRPPSLTDSPYGPAFQPPPFAPEAAFHVLHGHGRSGPPTWVLENPFVDYSFIVENMA